MIFILQSRDRTYLSISAQSFPVDTPAVLMELPSRDWHLRRIVDEMVNTGGWIIMDSEIDILSDSKSAAAVGVPVMWTAYFAGCTKSVNCQWFLRRSSPYLARCSCSVTDTHPPGMGASGTVFWDRSRSR